MADPSNPASGSPPSPQRRRSSFIEFFNPRPASNAPRTTSPPSTSPPTAIPQQPAQPRSISVALGLSSSSPSQTSPFNAFAKQRRASVATSSGSDTPVFRNSFGDEPAVIEEDDSTAAARNPPSSPSFARRLSFGAQALRDVRQGSSSGPPSDGRQPSSLYTLSENQENAAPPTAATSGEGFNWSESLRDRTKRSPSFSAAGNPFARPRVPSQPVPEPPKEVAKPPPPTPTRMKKPDHLGERMLRGDFMMD